MADKRNCPSIRCPACEGSGRRCLSTEYVETWNAFRKLGQATCDQVRKYMGLVGGNDRTLIHKRAERLRAWGLLKRVRQITQAETNLKSWVFEAVD